MLLEGFIRDEDDNQVDVRINCYWVTCKRDGVKVFVRSADGKNPWLDKQHQQVIEALENLEKAIRAVLPK